MLVPPRLATPSGEGTAGGAQGWDISILPGCHRFGPVGMAPAKSRCAPSGQIVATGRGLFIRRVRSEYSFPFVFSPRVISPRSPWNRTESWGYTDLGEVVEPAPPTYDAEHDADAPPTNDAEHDA